ncbi:hypothetical protein HYH03_014241 [Edaphochlamys debaryana]|uniref:Ion transport domain-containing protein n=1 Tax=Edaphochlamys debaryana TaxID=47281 RepID=A0A835XN52_9CHLO|nr:hypothetical protein HYH03_014241 [Edaphochlamys debaryana]|eukprot:KAG2487128.1 hypothetical protein HYH03_014241 [Edaphochlamys debaryana]
MAVASRGGQPKPKKDDTALSLSFRAGLGGSNQGKPKPPDGTSAVELYQQSCAERRELWSRPPRPVEAQQQQQRGSSAGAEPAGRANSDQAWTPPDVLTASRLSDPITAPGARLLDAVLRGNEQDFDAALKAIESTLGPEECVKACSHVFISTSPFPALNGPNGVQPVGASGAEAAHVVVEMADPCGCRAAAQPRTACSRLFSWLCSFWALVLHLLHVTCCCVCLRRAPERTPAQGISAAASGGAASTAAKSDDALGQFEQPTSATAADDSRAAAELYERERATAEELYRLLRSHAYLTKACSPLSAAAALGRTEMVRRLLAAGAEPDPWIGQWRVLGRGACWVSPLAAAALWGDAEIVELLLKGGSVDESNTKRKADPNGLSCVGGVCFPPLLLTSNWAVAESLIGRGAKVKCLNPHTPSGLPQPSQPPRPSALQLAMTHRLAADDHAWVSERTLDANSGPQWHIFSSTAAAAGGGQHPGNPNNDAAAQGFAHALWRGCWLLHAADPRLVDLWVKLGGHHVATATHLFPLIRLVGNTQQGSIAPAGTTPLEPACFTILEAAMSMQLAVDVSDLVRAGTGMATKGPAADTSASGTTAAPPSPAAAWTPDGYECFPTIIASCLRAGHSGEALAIKQPTRDQYIDGRHYLLPGLMNRVWQSQQNVNENCWCDIACVERGQTLLGTYLHLHGSRLPQVWGPWLPPSIISPAWQQWSDSLQSDDDVCASFNALQSAIVNSSCDLAAEALLAYTWLGTHVSAGRPWSKRFAQNMYSWVCRALSSSQPAPKDGPAEAAPETKGASSGRVTLSSDKAKLIFGQLLIHLRRPDPSRPDLQENRNWRLRLIHAAVQQFISSTCSSIREQHNPSRGAEFIAWLISHTQNGDLVYPYNPDCDTVACLLVGALPCSRAQLEGWIAAIDKLRPQEKDSGISPVAAAAAAADGGLRIEIKALVESCLEVQGQLGCPCAHPEIAALLCRYTLQQLKSQRQADSQMMRDCIALLAQGISQSPAPAIDPSEGSSQLGQLLRELADRELESGYHHLATLLSATGLSWGADDAQGLSGDRRLMFVTRCPRLPGPLHPTGRGSYALPAVTVRLSSLDELGHISSGQSSSDRDMNIEKITRTSCVVDPFKPGGISLLEELGTAFFHPIAYTAWFRQHLHLEACGSGADGGGSSHSTSGGKGGRAEGTPVRKQLTLRQILSRRLQPMLWAAAAMATQGWLCVGAVCGLTYVLLCGAAVLVLAGLRGLVDACITCYLSLHWLRWAFSGAAWGKRTTFHDYCFQRFGSRCKDDSGILGPYLNRPNYLAPQRAYTALVSKVPLPAASGNASTTSLLTSFTKLLDDMLDSNSPHMWASPSVKALVMSHWNCFTLHVASMMFMLRAVYTVVFIIYALSLLGTQDPVDADDVSAGVKPENVHRCPTDYQMPLMTVLVWMTAEYAIAELRQLWAAGNPVHWFEQQAWNFFDAVEMALMGATLALHWSCTASLGTLLCLSEILVLVLFWRLMQYASISRRMGRFVRMVLEVTSDLGPFFIFLAVVYCGFGVALMVVSPGFAAQ